MDTDYRATVARDLVRNRPPWQFRHESPQTRGRMTHVLLITNQPPVNGQPGYEAGLRTLAEGTELTGFDVVPAIYSSDEDPPTRASRIAQAIDASPAEVLLCLSLKSLVPMTDDLTKALKGREVIYWEGDAWGGRKRLPAPSADWLRASSIVFTVAGPPQVQLLLDHGAREVRHTIHTYDQTLFSDNPRTTDEMVSVVFAGNNLARVPALSGLPGSHARRRLVAHLRRRFGRQFRVAGRGWPSRYGSRYVPYPHLGAFIGSGRIMAAWEHFPTFSAYASDRLAVCMVTGRVQVTSRPADPWWIPEGVGVFATTSWRNAVERIEELASLPPAEILATGLLARQWALGRLSHIEALRHMLRSVAPGVQAPPADPWARLPGPWISQ